MEKKLIREAPEEIKESHQTPQGNDVFRQQEQGVLDLTQSQRQFNSRQEQLDFFEEISKQRNIKIVRLNHKQTWGLLIDKDKVPFSLEVGFKKCLSRCILGNYQQQFPSGTDGSLLEVNLLDDQSVEIRIQGEGGEEEFSQKYKDLIIRYLLQSVPRTCIVPLTAKQFKEEIEKPINEAILQDTIFKYEQGSHRLIIAGALFIALSSVVISYYLQEALISLFIMPIGFSTSGALLGSIVGPVGMAIGASVGFIAGVVANILDKKTPVKIIYINSNERQRAHFNIMLRYPNSQDYQPNPQDYQPNHNQEQDIQN